MNAYSTGTASLTEKGVKRSLSARCARAVFPLSMGLSRPPSEFLYGIRPRDMDMNGGAQIIHIRFGDGARIVAQAPEDFEIRAGDACRFRPRPERAHVFDPQSGRRIAAQQENPS